MPHSARAKSGDLVGGDRAVRSIAGTSSDGDLQTGRAVPPRLGWCNGLYQQMASRWVMEKVRENAHSPADMYRTFHDHLDHGC